MAEPPPKRARRTDSAAMWEQNTRAPPRGPSGDADADLPRRPPRNRSPADRRRRSRSRSRDRDRDRRRDRDGRADGRSAGVRRASPEGRDRRDVRDGRDKGRRYDPRGRSRSPADGAPTNSRVRSPPRGPRNARSRDRDRDRDRLDKPRPREKDGEREREKQRTKDGGGVQLNGGPKKPSKAAAAPVEGKPNGQPVKPVGCPMEADDEETALRKLMGFSGFKSTKNTKVPGNEFNYGVRKEKKTQYRQYMNRPGGFNRPLSPG